MITIGYGHNCVTLTEGECREVMQKSSDVMSLVMYAAQVGMKLRDDYNLSIDVLPQQWAFEFIHDCWVDGMSIAETAFRITNEQTRGGGGQ